MSLRMWLITWSRIVVTLPYSMMVSYKAYAIPATRRRSSAKKKLLKMAWVATTMGSHLIRTIHGMQR